MNINFASDDRLIKQNCSIIFPEPEIIGFTGPDGDGRTGLFGNHMSSIVPLDNGFFRVYLTRRFWSADQKTSMDIGFVDTPDLARWPELQYNYRRLELENFPDGISRAQPYVLRKDGLFELFFWVHGAGMIRYVKCISHDGIRFKILNLDRPCLYHPADRDVRCGAAADGLLTVKDNLRDADDKSRAVLLRNKISNDATTIRIDPATGFYNMYSVTLLDSKYDPQRNIGYDNGFGWIRVIHHRTSRDGLEWSEPEIVLMPNERDRNDLQCYVLQSMSAGNFQAGLLGHYPVADQVMEMEPLISGNNVSWKRSGTPWTIRGRIPGAERPDMMLFPGGMLEYNGRIWIAATSFSYKHNQPGKLRPEQYRQRSFVLRQRSDRWAGLVNHNGVGQVITPPSIYDSLKIDAEMNEKVSVSLRSPFGNELISGGIVQHDGRIAFPGGADSAFYGKWLSIKLCFTTIVYNIKSNESNDKDEESKRIQN